MIEAADIVNAKLPKDLSAISNSTINGRMYLPSDFDEIKLYALLRWRFKRPNGIISAAIGLKGDPDAPFKWDFLFVPCEGLILHIIRAIDGIEVVWRGRAIEGQKVINYLANNISKYSDRINDELQAIEKHSLILNPFVRHRSLVRLAKDELNDINPRKPIFPKNGKKAELEKYKKRFLAYMNESQKQASVTHLLVLESAFMAESYLNLILAFLLRPEIKASKSIFNETLRRSWRSKVERLPVDCLYISNKPNMGDMRIQNAKKMFDLRNKLAHSYPDRKDMKIGEVWFQDNFPILAKGESFQDYTLALHNQLPSKEDALFCVESSEGFINFLDELIDSKIREDFEFAVNSNPIGFNEKRNIFSMPFGKKVLLGIAMS